MVIRRSVKMPLRYGWVRDLPDQRDHLYAAPAPVLKKLPATVDLRRLCPPVYDQGHLGSCTANALAGAYAFDLKLQKKRLFQPSRLFIYYNERAMEGTVRSDSGGQLRDGMKSLNSQGVCPESLWPYEVCQFTELPTAKAYKAALEHQALGYQRVAQTLPQMKGCLAAGFPFVFGFAVYESFETPQVAKTGLAQMPAAWERRVGGHAVMAVGYDDASQRFLVRNSWGEAWGKKGYFTMPYAYVADAHLAADHWTIRVVEG